MTVTFGPPKQMEGTCNDKIALCMHVGMQGTVVTAEQKQNFRSGSLSNPRENGPGSLLSLSLRSLTFLFLQ